MSRLLHALLDEPAPDAFSAVRGTRLFWRLQITGWCLVFVCGTLLITPTFGFGDSVLVVGMRALCGFVGTSLLRQIYVRVAWRSYSPPVLLACVALLCLLAALAETALLRGFVFTEVRLRFDPTTLGMLDRILVLLRWGSFSGWSVLYFAILLWRDSTGAALRSARIEAAARTAELRQLQAQVNPHFLFNALNSIVAQKDDPEAVEKTTGELAGYLRHALRAQEDFHPLGAELDLLERYLRVEKSRFEERLVYSIEAGPDARAVPVPPAFVQPLLENACKHGRRTGPRVLEIRIEARVANGALLIEVTNTGRWLETPAADSHGIGLANLRRRLELLSGGTAALSHREENGRVIARLSWPLAAKEAAT